MTGREMGHQTGTAAPTEAGHERRWAERPPSRRRVPRTVPGPVGSLTALVLLVAAFASQAAPAAANAVCSNEARRVEQLSAYLPDCRAYEQVTPSAKDSSEPTAVPVGLTKPGLEGIEGAQVASAGTFAGDRLAWVSEYALPGSPSPGLQYLSTRGEGGWSSLNVIPPQSPANGTLCPNLVGIVAWSSDMSKGMLADGFGQENPSESFLAEGLECGHDEPRLVTGEPEGFQNLFLRDNATGSYELVNVTPRSVATPKPTEAAQEYHPANFLAASSDLSHVVFEEELKLTPNAPIGFPGGDELYEWSGGAVHLVTVLPNGAPVHGTLGGATANKEFPLNVANFRHAVSADGSRVFFEAEGDLYVRENGSRPQSALGGKGECLEAAEACTIQLDLVQGGKGPGGGGRWLAANAEGTKVFFTDEASAGLTADTQEGSGTNLYEYELSSDSGRPGTLIDLTPAPEAGVLGLSGTGQDGSSVYFVADGALTGEPNASGMTATAGQPNLYVFHAGRLTFVATLAGGDSCDWTSNTGCGGVEWAGLTARVSSNGTFLVFNSLNSLTGYGNVGPSTSEPVDEIYLYDMAANSLNCVSCQPSGAAPTAGGAAIRWPAKPDTNNEQTNAYPQRNVSDTGQVFFETNEALVLQDTNAQRDVYEYAGGALDLISSGTSEAGSFFLDATPNGGDVFFATAQPLLRSDTDSSYDYYDARVGGGFVEPPAPAQPCESEACKAAAPAVPALMAPASVGFAGAGDLVSPVKQSANGQKAARLRLQRALRACRRAHRHDARRLHLCERRARRRYGGKAARAGRRDGQSRVNRSAR